MSLDKAEAHKADDAGKVIEVDKANEANLSDDGKEVIEAEGHD